MMEFSACVSCFREVLLQHVLHYNKFILYMCTYSGHTFGIVFVFLKYLEGYLKSDVAFVQSLYLVASLTSIFVDRIHSCMVME